MKNKIGILTSGGDCQGMNACLYYLALICEQSGIELIGINQGYQGLIDKKYQGLKSEELEKVKDTGGTILKSSRCQAMFTSEGQSLVAQNIKDLGLTSLVVLGGDGSAQGAQILQAQFGINTVVIPATIDNDMKDVSLSLGHLSAVDRANTMIGWIEDTARSHDRIFIVEVMGRHSGNIAKALGEKNNFLAVVLPETKVEPELIDQIKSNFTKNQSHVVVITELQPEKIAQLKNGLKDYDLRVNVLGHGQRGGPPTQEESQLAKEYAQKAVTMCQKHQHGVVSK